MPTDRYNGTTKEQRKMARLIAADVLKTMRYLKVATDAYIIAPDALVACDIQSAPLKDLRSCTVCALGAMYVSRARLFNDFVFPGEFQQISSVPTSVYPEIGRNNAGLIESAFEGLDRTTTDMPIEALRASIAFGKRYSDHRKRLRAIMRNVIENKGVFRPPVPKAKKVVAK